ncbi:MAG: hypothetical protein ACRENN_10280, partial [Candidatus Eiseniibacteriota bacterium]
TVDYPAGNRTTVPMVNFKASMETAKAEVAKDGVERLNTEPLGANPNEVPVLKLPEADKSNRE